VTLSSTSYDNARRLARRVSPQPRTTRTTHSDWMHGCRPGHLRVALYKSKRHDNVTFPHPRSSSYTIDASLDSSFHHAILYITPYWIRASMSIRARPKPPSSSFSLVGDRLSGPSLKLMIVDNDFSILEIATNCLLYLPPRVFSQDVNRVGEINYAEAFFCLLFTSRSAAASRLFPPNIKSTPPSPSSSERNMLQP